MLLLKEIPKPKSDKQPDTTGMPDFESEKFAA